MKILEFITVDLCDAKFHIRPFGAFVAAEICADLTALATPMIGSLGPLFELLGDESDSGNGGEGGGLLDIEVEKIVPAISGALSTLAPNQLIRLMKKLLVDYGNITVEHELTQGQAAKLNMDLANEIFCLNVQDMFVLCYHVLKLNFSGFFKKLGARFGNLQDVIQRIAPSMTGGDTSTVPASERLS